MAKKRIRIGQKNADGTIFFFKCTHRLLFGLGGVGEKYVLD